MTTRTYRCLDCLEETVDRGFDVSHMRLTCEGCGEFSRYVQERVYQQFREFEESPPSDFDWDRLGKMEKFMLAEKMVREGKTVDDFDLDVNTDEAPSETGEADAPEGTASGTTAVDDADAESGPPEDTED